MNGSGCKNCPVKPCETTNYRGSTCAAQRAKFGLGDPQTNADRIRAMTDEELEKFIQTIKTRAVLCKAVKNNDAFNELCSIEWLKQPVK